jgi:hypothetical protein
MNRNFEKFSGRPWVDFAASIFKFLLPYQKPYKLYGFLSQPSNLAQGMSQIRYQ